MTRLTILGGSAAGVGTGQGCTGYLVQSDSTSIVLDLGPNTLLELRKHTDFRRLDGIVISHLHMDHVLDLFAMRFALAYNPERPPRPIPLWLPPSSSQPTTARGTSRRSTTWPNTPLTASCALAT